MDGMLDGRLGMQPPAKRAPRAGSERATKRAGQRMEQSDERKAEPVLEKAGAERLEAPMETAKLKTHKSTARLGKDIQHQIGLQLRAVWADVVDEGVPERFVELLRRLSETR